MFGSDEDERLMILYVEGDERAFAELYRRYKSKVFGFLCKRVDARVAEELFQTTFLKLHRSREVYDPQKPFPVWLFAICRNVLNDHLRATQRQIITTNTDPDSIGIERNVEVSSQGVTIDNAVAALPARQREAIQMRFAEGLEFDQIASRLSTTRENARQLLSRSLRALKRKIGE